MKQLLTAVVTATALFAGISSAQAEYPTSPVQFVIPFPPGDFEDILTRMIAKNMEEKTGVSASVVNKPGGGDGPFPGALEVLNGPADGSMVGSFVIAVPVVGPDLDIGIEEDSFTPVGIFLTYPFVLASKGDSGYSNMAELAEYSKENDVVLGHFGAGLTPTRVSMAGAKRLGFEFSDDSAYDMLDCNTLSSGDADVINTTLALIEPCLDELNIIASIGSEPIEKLDGVETIASQTGVTDIELWNGLFVKKGTPQEVVDVLAEITKETMMGEDAQTLMKETGARVYFEDASESAARIASDRKKSAALNVELGE